MELHAGGIFERGEEDAEFVFEAVEPAGVGVFAVGRVDAEAATDVAAFLDAAEYDEVVDEVAVRECCHGVDWCGMVVEIVSSVGRSRGGRGGGRNGRVFGGSGRRATRRTRGRSFRVSPI